MAHDVLQDDIDAVRGLIRLHFDSDSDLDPDDEIPDDDEAFPWDLSHASRNYGNSSDEESINKDQRSWNLDNAACNKDLNPPEVMDSAPTEVDDGVGPITWIRDQFLKYVDAHANNHVALNPDEKRAIKLLAALRKKKVALNGYQEIMEWHLKESGVLRDHETVSGCQQYIGRQTMLDRLKERYNFENKYPFQKKVKLPISGTVVKITRHDAGSQIQQLLTDPRIQDSDYLYFDNDPRAPPPQKRTKLRDFNAGDAFRETHRALIDPTKGEQLLGLPVYIDGAHSSNFHDVELIQVKIALGLMNRVTRMMEWVWERSQTLEGEQPYGGPGCQ